MAVADPALGPAEAIQGVISPASSRPLQSPLTQSLHPPLLSQLLHSSPATKQGEGVGGGLMKAYDPAKEGQALDPDAWVQILVWLLQSSLDFEPVIYFLQTLENVGEVKCEGSFLSTEHIKGTW